MDKSVPNPPPMKPYLTMHQAAKLVCVCHGTIKNWVRNGLPHTRIGRVVRIHADDLTQFMEMHKVSENLVVKNAVDALINGKGATP